jgi:hypothetical protein
MSWILAAGSDPALAESIEQALEHRGEVGGGIVEVVVHDLSAVRDERLEVA